MTASKAKFVKNSERLFKEEFRVRTSNINHLIDRARLEEKNKKRIIKIVFTLIIASFSAVGLAVSL